MTAPKPVVLACLGSFWPGSDSSGPNQSFRAMCAALGQDFTFKVVARDAPFGQKAERPFADWVDLGFAQARYLPAPSGRPAGLTTLLRATQHDLLLLNGFFDREFTLPVLIARRLGRLARTPAILSPRGEFASGALGLKSPQKRAWLWIARRTGMLKGVTLHATSPHELADMRRALAWVDRFALAANAPRALTARPPVPRGSGPLRIVFVGRISPVKNLDVALQVLSRVRVPCQFDIAGPVQDAAYWAHCQPLIAALPDTVRVRHLGETANEAIPALLSGYDLFFLPTKGENFGQAIFEALSCGVPVLISDTTPWRGLAASGAGWDIPLSDLGAFAEAIETAGRRDAAAQAEARTAAHAMADAHVRSSTARADLIAMFQAAMGRAA
jgi:glycosyltransferase involved in cell wall biosynthesis